MPWPLWKKAMLVSGSAKRRKYQELSKKCIKCIGLAGSGAGALGAAGMFSMSGGGLVGCRVG